MHFGGDKLGGKPDTGRIQISIALTFLLHDLCVTIEGCRQMGSSFVKLPNIPFLRFLLHDLCVAAEGYRQMGSSFGGILSNLETF